MMLVKLMAAGMLVAGNCFSDQLSISNETTRVVLDSTGGRLIEYSLGGKNILYVDPSLENWKWDGKGYQELDGGRCDIGPAAILPKHYDLWLGEWELEKTGKFSMRATSVINEELGVQLVRDRFRTDLPHPASRWLGANGSRQDLLASWNDMCVGRLRPASRETFRVPECRDSHR